MYMQYCCCCRTIATTTNDNNTSTTTHTLTITTTSTTITTNDYDNNNKTINLALSIPNVIALSTIVEKQHQVKHCSNVIGYEPADFIVQPPPKTIEGGFTFFT